MAKKTTKRFRITAAPDHYRQDPSDVSFWWRCKCHKQNRPEAWSYLDLAARGSPVCPRCGEDMQLEMP